MRIVEKFLYGIVSIIGLILLFIIVCHFNPALSERIGNSVQAREKITIEGEEKKTENSQEIATYADVQQNGLSDKLESTREYDIPNESELKIPVKVASLSGYEPVVEDGKQITNKRAEILRSELEVGNTGDEYTYDEKYYPYYHMLNDSGKQIYRQLHANTEQLLTTFKPVLDTVNARELRSAFTALFCDHPELFWLNRNYAYKYAPNGTVIEIDLSFNYTANNLEESKSIFDQAAKDYIYGSRGLKSDYDEELYIHDRLAKNISYDLNAPINQSAYSALVQKRTVCAGYARAFQYIMQQLDIPCYYCMGYAGQNHAWNIIKLDSDYYNVDVTWDDTTPMTYDYFNCSDAAYANDHTRRDLSIYLPPCLGNRYSDLEENEEERLKREQAEIEKIKEELKKEEEEAKEKEAQQEIEEETGSSEEIKIDFNRYDESDRIIFDNLDDYYTDCAQAMMDDDDNSISFINYVSDEKMWNKIKKAYEKNEYSKAYMERVLADKHKSTCQAKVTGQKLEDGTYLIRHIMTLK